MFLSRDVFDFLSVDLANLQNKYLTYRLDDVGDDKASFTVDVPGFKESDLNIEVKNSVVSITGEVKSGQYVRSIARSFSIPKMYDANTIDATLEDGVLTLTLSKVAEKVIDTKKVLVHRK